MSRDYYEILGVARDASPEQLKKAYRRLAMELHPDRNPDRHDAEERFKELSEAYAVLSDPDKRRRYDQFGEAGVKGGPGGFDPSSFQDIFGQAGFGGLEDLFESFFGGGAGRAGGRRAQRARQGASLRYELEVTLEEAFAGKEMEIRVPQSEDCPRCGGAGAPAEGIDTCGTCGGAGQVVSQIGFMRIGQTCPACGGRGQTIRTPCEECQGRGRVQHERAIKVRIPPGVDTGTRLRLPGRGDGGSRGGPPGDLFVDIVVREDERFVREGADLHFELPVAFADLVLGAERKVPGIEGEETCEIPAGTDPGTVLRMRSRGMPHLGRKGRGDLLAHVVAKTPRKPNARERELWTELQQLDNERAAKRGEGGFFGKVKDFLGGE